MRIDIENLPVLDSPVALHGSLGGGDPGAVTSPDIYLMIAIYVFEGGGGGGMSDSAHSLI